MPQQLEQATFALDRPRGALPYLDQYFGVWAIELQRFTAAYEQVRRLNLGLHLESPRVEHAQAQAQAAAGRGYAVEGGVAIVHLQGTLMKHVSSLDNGSSSVLAKRQIRIAARDETVAGILLLIDSPGGTVSGTKDLADEVVEARKRKPVYAFVEDLGASAAYWIASQAEKVFANATALVGSIGTYMVLEDLSGMADQLGVKVHVIKAGDFKGMGVPGTEVTEDQITEAQRVVNELNAHFLQAVAAGRGLSAAKVKELADGRVHVGKAAAALGLIDGVQTIEATIQQLSKRKGKPMSESAEKIIAASAASLEVATAGPASFAELKAGCVGADPAFICQQQEANATLAQAQKAWMGEQANRLQATQQQLAEAKAAKPAEAVVKKPGVDPVASKGQGAAATFEGDPISQWNEAVDAKVKAGMSKSRAISAVAKANPALHAAYVEAHNLEHGNTKGFARSRFADAV